MTTITINKFSGNVICFHKGPAPCQSPEGRVIIELNEWIELYLTTLTTSAVAGFHEGREHAYNKTSKNIR